MVSDTVSVTNQVLRRFYYCIGLNPETEQEMTNFLGLEVSFQIIFGETAGQQCLAMCLCALIYNNRQGIYTSQDLVQLMTYQI